jgi:pSer/pThr/pTyr-binding forkhead associated (FHA) protein
VTFVGCEFVYAWCAGRQADAVDIPLDHPSASRQHAVIQHRSGGLVYVFDLGSTHGTFVNKKRISAHVHVPLHIGDVVKFGESSRLFILNGPEELRPPEQDMPSSSSAIFTSSSSSAAANQAKQALAAKSAHMRAIAAAAASTCDN